MTKKVYYLPFCDEVNERIDKIINDLICFVETKIIEMNYLQVTIKCRNEDLKTVEKILADVI